MLCYAVYVTGRVHGAAAVAVLLCQALPVAVCMHLGVLSYAAFSVWSLPACYTTCVITSSGMFTLGLESGLTVHGCAAAVVGDPRQQHHHPRSNGADLLSGSVAEPAAAAAAKTAQQCCQELQQHGLSQQLLQMAGMCSCLY
jgi:hypothetical protein